MAQTGFSAIISTAKTPEWLDPFVAKQIEESSTMIIVRRAPGNVILDFLVNSSENVLFRGAKSLQHILDEFVATSTPFSVQTSVNERVADAYYRWGQGDRSLEDIGGWVKKVPIYYPVSCKMRGKTAYNPGTYEQDNVSEMLNSDANHFAVFTAIGSGDGVGNITVFHKDNITYDKIREAVRYGCKKLDHGSSIDHTELYIDLQALGAEFGIFVPEGEFQAMLHGTPRVYAAIPGIEKFPVMANEEYAETGMAAIGGLHCQGDQSGINREYAISHLVPCPDITGGFVTGNKCESTNLVFRRRKSLENCANPSWNTKERTIVVPRYDLAATLTLNWVP